LHQVGTSLLIYMMHGHTYIKLYSCFYMICVNRAQ